MSGQQKASLSNVYTMEVIQDNEDKDEDSNLQT